MSESGSASSTLTLKLRLGRAPGTLGRATTAIGEAGGDIEALDLLETGRGAVVRRVSVVCHDQDHAEAVVAAVRSVPDVEILEVSDRILDFHRGGKISVAPRFPLRTREDLAIAYTPGVGRVSRAIADDPDLGWEFTIKGNSVAVVTDGSAVLGLGNIGPLAALPVMEGKAMLFKELAGIDAYPLCLRANDPDSIVAATVAVSPGFGGINLEDIAAPACFEVEERLREELEIPVFHDDQHGTAVVTLAALLNALRLTGRRIENVRVAILGMGAAGMACARLLLTAGVGDVVGADRSGVLHPGRPGLDGHKRWIAEHTNHDGVRGGVQDALQGADVFLGVSGPGLVQPQWLEGMAKDSIVFALANPVPEIMPDDVPGSVRVVATGRSDFPNQINNVLVFPGFFRGLLDAKARSIDDEMKIAAARALAGLVGDDELTEDYVIPSPFDDRVVPAVSEAVRLAAAGTGQLRTDPATTPSH